MAKASRIAAILLLSILLVTNIYRAIIQSLVHDEGLTLMFYLTQPVSAIFTVYDANNHFLATLLMKLSTALFGYSEPAIRLVSLGAGALYFFTVYRLCLYLFGEGLLFFVSVVLLSANPLLLDFLVAARGYGPGMAFFFFALYCLLLYSTGSRSRGVLYLGATGLSFSVMCNLTFLFPAFMAAALFLVSARARSRAAFSSQAAHFLLPIAAFGLFLWFAGPYHDVRSESLYKTPAATTIIGSIQNQIDVSLAHNEGLGHVNPTGGPARVWRSILALCVFPLVVLGSLFLAIRTKQHSPAGIALFWTSGILTGSMPLYALGNHVLDFPYPADRTGVHLVPLAGLTLVSLTKVLRSRSGWGRFVAGPCLALGIVFAIHYAVQYNWDHFYVWRYDADNKRILEKLQAIRARRQAPPRVEISWQLGPSFYYYGWRRKLDWAPHSDRSGLRGGYHYYVLIRQDQGLVAKFGLKSLYRGPVSGTLLAARNP